MKRKLILGLALGWALLALLEETSRALTGWDGRSHDVRALPARWRLDTPPVADLAACLALVRERVPPGKVVVFVSPADEGGPGKSAETGAGGSLESSEFFRWRWAAFLLPEHEVAPLDDPTVPQVAEYALAYRRAFANPRLEPLAGRPGCTLFRVRRP